MCLLVYIKQTMARTKMVSTLRPRGWPNLQGYTLQLYLAIQKLNSPDLVVRHEGEQEYKQLIALSRQ